MTNNDDSGDGALCYQFFVAETHSDYWSVDDLAERLPDALCSLG